jgi:LmbE family N-acetylglucosaminyl deacetylase
MPGDRRGARRLRGRPALAVALLLALSKGHAADSFRAVTDRTTYDVGSEVQLRVLSPAHNGRSPIELLGIVRYEGESSGPSVGHSMLYFGNLGSQPPAGYLPLWRIPTGAATGRYDVDLEVRELASHRLLESDQKAASFAVHRKLVRIERVELDKTFYMPGDPVRATVVLTNLTGSPLSGLRVEFSNRYWPWIAGPAEQAAASIVPLETSLNLGAHAELTIAGNRTVVAPEVDQPSLHQYGVVVWDHARREILDIAFSRLVFINPSGLSAPQVYPGQYVYPDLGAVNFKSYRHFYPPSREDGAIAFDHQHTMYTPGAAATVSFGLTDPGPEPWRGVKVQARLLGPDGAEVAKRTVESSVDIEPARVPAMERTVDFQLPAEVGLDRVEVRVTAPSGEVLARSHLELGVNSLPRAILIFNAHEDDEGGWDGLIRAAVENQVPVYLAYFTGGDAGSCDRYYEHSCGPAESLNFGSLRMQESRAVLAHLGVPAEDIFFLGLPDGGSGQIWYHHPNRLQPYLSVLLASDHAPYESLFRPNLPFARDAVLEAAEELIRRLQPQTIVTAHPPSEGHIDHIVNGYFAVKALQDLARQHAVPADVQVLVDRVYVPKELPPTPYHYREHVFYVSGEAAALAQEAGWLYQSQGGNRGEGNLRDFDQLPRQQPYREMIDWKEHEGWNEKEPESAGKL